MLKRVFSIAALGLLLAGCAAQMEQFKAKSFTDQLNVLCETYSGTLDVLTTLGIAGKLSPGNINTIQAIRPGLNKTCYGGKSTTVTQVVINTVTASLNMLKAIRSQRE